MTAYRQCLRTRSCFRCVVKELKDQFLFCYTTLSLSMIAPVSRRVFVKWKLIQSRDIRILCFTYSASKSV